MNILAQTTSNSGAAAGAGLILFLIFLFWGGPIIAGYFIGKNKGRTAAGVLLPFFLGWLGVIIVACLGSDHPQFTQVNVVTNPVTYQQPQPYQRQPFQLQPYQAQRVQQQHSGQPLPPPGQPLPPPGR